jgi:hypothetical protein
MDVIVNMAPISATRVRVMFISPEEIRSVFLLLSCHAQPYLLACAQPSGSKGLDDIRRNRLRYFNVTKRTGA